MSKRSLTDNLEFSFLEIFLFIAELGFFLLLSKKNDVDEDIDGIFKILFFIGVCIIFSGVFI